jgi:hypothetical protein
VAQANRIFAADRAGREITNMEKQRIFETAQVVDEDVILVARVEASRHECSERKIHRLLGETRRRRKQSDTENKKTKSQAQSPHSGRSSLPEPLAGPVPLNDVEMQ